MFYQLRRKDGQPDPFSAGALVDAHGGARPLARDDVRLEVLATWRSPRSGVTYPAAGVSRRPRAVSCSRWRRASPARS